jgi:hypothetical protein
MTSSKFSTRLFTSGLFFHATDFTNFLPSTYIGKVGELVVPRTSCIKQGKSTEAAISLFLSGQYLLSET